MFICQFLLFDRLQPKAEIVMPMKAQEPEQPAVSTAPALAAPAVPAPVPAAPPVVSVPPPVAPSQPVVAASAASEENDDANLLKLLNEEET